MPTISMFFGIVVTMNYNDHMPPHIHVKYGEYKDVYTFDGDAEHGTLPRKQAAMVQAWVLMHEDELRANWELARAHEELYRIDPLR